MALPPLTDEQRRQALEKAAAARRQRAAIKAELKSGRRTLRSLLSTEEETVKGMKVSAVLEALPGVGKRKAQLIMERLDISATRRVRGLGPKQREALLAEFPS